MTVKFREFTGSDADYDLLTTLWNTAWPEIHREPDLYRHDDSTRPEDAYFVRLFIELDGKTVGVGDYMEDWETAEEDDWFYLLAILPSVDFATVAAPFVDRMMADARRRGRILQAGTIAIEDRLSHRAFFESLGYKLAMREPRSELNVDQFDFSKYLDLPAKMEAEKIEIACLTDLQDRFPDWQRRIYELDWEISKDVPSTVEFKKMPFDEFADAVFKSPRHLPEANFYALDGDEWVGASILKQVLGKDDELSVGITGILPSHRRRGIATALKLKTIEYAKANGVKTIKTDNEENNPMYTLNLKLGFEAKPAFLIFEQKFEEAATVEVDHG